MATASTTVRTNFVGDASGLNRALRSTRQEAAKTTKGAKGLDGTINKLKLGLAAIGGVAVGRGIMTSISAASDLNETLTKTGVLFGESSDEVVSWSKTAAKAFGQSQQQALDAASTFATFGKSAGLSGQQLVGFSESMTELASDMASFSNTSPEDAITAIGAAMRGEMEPIRKYGVLLDDASLRQEALAMGLIKTTKQALTPQQKVLASQALILKQTTAAQGDFARTSDGLANSQRIMQAELADASAQLGQMFLPAMTAVVHAATAALTIFNEIPGPVKAATLAFVGMAVATKLLAPRASAARDALSNLILDIRTAPNRVAPFRSALGGVVGLLGGPWGLALTAGVTAVTLFASSNKRASKEVQGLTDSLQFQNGVLDDNSKKTLATTLAQKGLFDVTSKLGLSEKRVTDAIVGGGAARDDLLRQLDEIQAANMVWVGSGKMATQRLNIQGQAAHQAEALIREYGNSIDGSAESSTQAARATGEAAAATDEVAGAVEKAKGKYEKFTDAIDAAKKAMDNYLGISRDIEGATRDAEAAVDDLRQSFKDNGKTLDIHTEKGRANREAIEDAAQAALDEAAANQAAGASMDKVNGKYDKRIKKILDEAEAHGANREEVRKYLVKLGLIPAKKTTKFETPGLNGAAQKVHQMARDWRSIVSGGPNLPAEMRASGGPVTRGRPYIVGEKRPELFVPNQSGTIIPSVPGGGGGSIHFHFHAPVITNDRQAADWIRSVTKKAGIAGVTG